MYKIALYISRKRRKWNIAFQMRFHWNKSNLNEPRAKTHIVSFVQILIFLILYFRPLFTTPPHKQTHSIRFDYELLSWASAICSWFTAAVSQTRNCFCLIHNFVWWRNRTCVHAVFLRFSWNVDTSHQDYTFLRSSAKRIVQSFRDHYCVRIALNVSASLISFIHSFVLNTKGKERRIHLWLCIRWCSATGLEVSISTISSKFWQSS